MYTYSRLKGQQNNGGGSGWSEAGRKWYDDLFLAVKADRKKHAKTFNPQLLLFFQARRRREQHAKTNAHNESMSTNLKRAYHRMDELADDSDDKGGELETKCHQDYDNEEYNNDDDDHTGHPKDVHAL